MEHQLRFWEDCWFLLDALRRTTMLAKIQNVLLKTHIGAPVDLDLPPMHSAKEFRSYLGTAKPARDLLHIDSRFLGKNTEWTVLSHLDTIAHDLLGWCATSKRVFALDLDLQILLRATSMGDMRWGEIKFPFVCFAIKLAEPMIHNHKSFDFLTIRNTLVRGRAGDFTRGLNISIASTKMHDYVPLTNEERERVNKKINRGDVLGSVKLINDFNTRFGLIPMTLETSGMSNALIAQELPPDGLLPGTLKDANPNRGDEETRIFMTQVLRTIAGLCLYLQTQPADGGSAKVIKPEQMKSLQPSNIPITNDQNILQIFAENVLSHEDREVLRDHRNERHEEGDPKASRGELTKPHFRRGYYRRPWGQGNNPEAKRTVRVPPVVVRPDLWNKGITPSGSQTTIKS